MLGHPDGGLEDTRAFRGDIVRAIRAIRANRPHTVFTHDPYRIRSFQHRDHRMAGIATTDAEVLVAEHPWCPDGPPR